MDVFLICQLQAMVLGLTFSTTSTTGNYFQWIINNNIAQTGNPKCYAPDSQFLLSLNILSFWTYNVKNFLKVSRIMSLPICHFRLSIFVLETLKFKRKSLAM